MRLLPSANGQKRIVRLENTVPDTIFCKSKNTVQDGVLCAQGFIHLILCVLAKALKRSESVDKHPAQVF
jgi:hypothetical protein